MKPSAQIIIEPIVTEKSSVARMEDRYTFKVSESANKIEIATAIEKLFNVKVLKVNTVKIPAKARRTGRFVGKISSFKKAYVKLAPGQKIAELESTT